MVRKIYRATKGAPFSKSDAQIYGMELDKISKENNGHLVAEEVVNKAEDRRNPLHNYFEWDDTTAGQRHRLWQARNLINHITVVIKYDHTQKEQKAFFSVNSTPNEKTKNVVYVNVEKVLSEPELRDQVLLRALTEIEYWQEKYAQYKELIKIFSAIKYTKKVVSKKLKKKKNILGGKNEKNSKKTR